MATSVQCVASTQATNVVRHILIHDSKQDVQGLTKSKRLGGSASTEFVDDAFFYSGPELARYSPVLQLKVSTCLSTARP